MNDLTLQERETVLTVRKTASNAVPLANIIELTTSVIAGMSKEGLSTSVKEGELSSSVLATLVARRIKDKVLTKGA